MGALITTISRNRYYTQEEMAWALREHAKHRQHDKQVALVAAKKDLEKLESRRKQIEGLGGQMGKELNDTLTKLRTAVVFIEGSDPLDTKLY